MEQLDVEEQEEAEQLEREAEAGPLGSAADEEALRLEAGAAAATVSAVLGHLGGDEEQEEQQEQGVEEADV